MSDDEGGIRERFAQRYGMAPSDLMVDIERRVIGGDWGANGYTTKAQVDELGARVRLAPGKRLLDIGSGRGWPGLYLAASTGCSAVLVDIPEEGLRTARNRAAAEGLGATTAQVVATATALPLRPDSFDALTHTDVLC